MQETDTLQPAFFSRRETFQELIPYNLLCKWPIPCSDCAHPQMPFFTNYIYIYLFVSLSVVHVHTGMHMPWGPCGRESALSFHHVGPDLRSSDSAFTRWAILTSFLHPDRDLWPLLQENTWLYKGSVLKRAYTILGEFLKSDSQVSSLRHEFISTDVVGVAVKLLKGI